MPHLIVALATSPSQGCQQAMKNLALPQLDRLLARLSPAGLDAGNETDFSPPHERALARHLGLAAGPAGTTPWAAWHRLQTPAHMPTDHGLAWAFITPCQWQADANHVLLADPAQLQLTEDDSRSLLAILAPWFAEDGITLVYDQPTRWLAHGAAFDGLATASLDRVLQRDVSSWLPDKLQARNLHRLHSEMQMLLYTHAFNEERSERGLPVVNSFWVHGTGALAGPPPATPSTPPPHMPTTLRDAALRDDWRAWASAWAALDAGPVADLLRRAESGTPVQLTLCGERNALGFHAAPRSLAQRFQGLFRPMRWSNMLVQL